MPRIRSQRIAEQMKKDLAQILRTDVKDPRIGFATITRVEVTSDLQHAKVFVSVLGDTQAKEQTMEALNRANGFIRGEIGRRLRMRIAPEISFKLDESGEYMTHIESVLKRIRPGMHPNEGPES